MNRRMVSFWTALTFLQTGVCTLLLSYGSWGYALLGGIGVVSSLYCLEKEVHTTKGKS